MTRAGVRLAVGVADALPYATTSQPSPGPEVEASPAAPVPETPAASPTPAPPPQPPLPQEPEPAARRRGALRRAFGVLRRPAAHLRALLTGSLAHQLQLQGERVSRTADTTDRVETLVRHLQAHGEVVGAHLRGLSEHLETIQARLAQAAAEAEALSARTGALEERSARALQEQQVLARRGLETGYEALERLGQVMGVLGPRFDELEIKVRPPMDIDDESVAVRVAEGYVMLPRSEPLFTTAVANATSGGLEPGVRRVLRALLDPGDAAADVGANVGLLTVAMGFAVGAAGRVWAFEPEARVRRQLERTLHLNGLRQVALSGAAVGAEPGRLTFHQSPIIGHSSLYPLPEDEQAAERAVEVEVVRLDDVVPPGTALAVVKIDVEGAELDVVRGMARVIAESPDLAVVAEFGPSHLHRVGVTPEAWFAAFSAHGLEPRLIAEPSGVTSPTSAGRLREVESANLVFIRPGGRADRRLPR